MPDTCLQLLSPAPIAFIDGLGGPEMVLIFVIVLLLFGGDKLPEFARGIGKTMREFKKAASGVEEEFRRAMDEDERKRAAAALPVPANPDPSAKSDPAAAGYPEDGSYNEYSEAGPSSTATPATPEPAATASPAPPAPAGEAEPQKNPAPAPAKPPVASEDYP